MLEDIYNTWHIQYARDKQLFSKFIEVIKLTFFSRFKQIWRLTSFWSSQGRLGIRFSTLTSSPSSYLWFILSIISLFVLLSNFFLEIHDIMLLCCFCRWLDFIFLRSLSQFFMDFDVVHCMYICPTSTKSVQFYQISPCKLYSCQIKI